ADEHGHGNGENENAGDDAQEQGEDLRAGAGVADEKLHETDELGNKEYESENEKAEEGVADDFSNYVGIGDGHGATREGNMGRGREGVGRWKDGVRIEEIGKKRSVNRQQEKSAAEICKPLAFSQRNAIKKRASNQKKEEERWYLITDC